MLHTRVDQAAFDKAQAMAAHLDISMSALLCELIEREAVDEHGRPSWESRYAYEPKTPDDGRGELPLSA